MSSTQTPNLGLNAWARTDGLLVGEMNRNFDAIDESLTKRDISVSRLGIKGDGSDETTLIRNALSESRILKRRLIFESDKVYRINRKITLHVGSSFIDLNNATLDFTNCIDEVAIEIIPHTTDKSNNIYSVLQNGKIIGPEYDESNNLDGIFIGRPSHMPSGNVANSVVRNIDITGFRDSVILGEQSYLNTFDNCRIGKSWRRGINCQMFTNAGEMVRFFGGVIYDVRNSQNTGVSLYTEGETNADFAFFGTSFDYCDMVLHHKSGMVTFSGCHLENDNINPMILTEYVPGSPLSLSMFGGSMGWGNMLSLFNPELSFREPDDGRDALIATVGGHCYIFLSGVDIKLYGKPNTCVHKNLDNDTPHVTIDSCRLNIQSGQKCAEVSDYTSILYNGGFELDTTGWTVNNSSGWAIGIDSTSSKSGSKSLKFSASSGSLAASVQQNLPLSCARPGKELLVSGWFKINSSTGYIVPILRFLGHDDVLIRQQSLEVDTNKLTGTANVWTRIGQSVVIPRGTHRIVIQIYCNGLTGNAWADDLKVWVN